MRTLAARPGFAAAVIGAVILLHLVAVPLVLRADQDFVYFGSRALPEACALRAAYGIPCPTCRMTRGVVLALHGRLRESAAVNASAPVLVGLGLLLGLFVSANGGLQLAGRASLAARIRTWTLWIGVAGGAAWLLALAANWIAELT